MPTNHRRASPQFPRRSEIKSSCARRWARLLPTTSAAWIAPTAAVAAAAGRRCGRSIGRLTPRASTSAVPEYRLRVDDQLDMTYRLTRDETSTPYRLNVGDEVLVESFTDQEINRSLLIQPDGTITLRLLGQVHAT